jgi:hypothetical protein
VSIELRVNHVDSTKSLTKYQGGGNLYAVDTTSHDVQRTLKSDGAIQSSPLVLNGTLYFGSED